MEEDSRGDKGRSNNNRMARRRPLHSCVLQRFSRVSLNLQKNITSPDSFVKTDGSRIAVHPLNNDNKTHSSLQFPFGTAQEVGRNSIFFTTPAVHTTNRQILSATSISCVSCTLSCSGRSPRLHTELHPKQLEEILLQIVKPPQPILHR